ncbi:MAG: hypothetical protein K0R80_759 [Clostridia bacterium]|jgi:hypothetical protein|nr:hypothetical protein [Clostridia bacterium]
MLLLNHNAASLQACIDSCIKCAQACNKCFRASLENDDINDMKEALSILVDCAEICYVTAAYMSKGTDLFAGLCSSCAELCERCANICEAYEDLHCQASVKACRQCAADCINISS